MIRFVIGLVTGILLVSLGWGLSPARGSSITPSPAFAAFSGTWTTHSGVLIVHPNGQGRIIFRTYRQCNGTIVTACDQWRGNLIYDGGFVKFTLKRVAGNTATGEVSNSAYSWATFTTIAVVLNRRKDTVNIRNAIRFQAPFCGPRAAPGTCGA
ncbi:MAG TPA: hypothetical protein VF898_03840 [Chloroflexota bacterium]